MYTPLVDDETSHLTVRQFNGESGPYHCYDCSIDFTAEHYLLDHLLHHIKQPSVRVSAIEKAPIKLTFKTKSDNSFEIIKSPTITEYQGDHDSTAPSPLESDTNLHEITTEDLDLFAGDHGGMDEESDLGDTGDVNHLNGLDDVTNTMFSSTFGCGTVGDSPAPSDESYSNMTSPQTMIHNHEHNTRNLNGTDIPGAEPTPPPESPSPTTDYPKIRIKTTGLLKEPLTITEITDDNPNGEFRASEIIELSNANSSSNPHPTNYWSNSLIEDPLKLPDSDNILTNFLNNTDHVSDNEFISLDRLDDRNSTALQVYNPSNSAVSTLDNLTGLPMQQLAEQVSRLQPSGNNSMHQQNVLINIQQFPQAPQQTPNYQHPSMYPPHPGMPAQPPPPPMYQHQPYQYQPSPMYYPPAPTYPQASHMPPLPQMQQPPSQQMPPPPPQQGMPPPPPQQPQYRQPMPPRPAGVPPPRQYGPQTPRVPGPRQPNFPPRQRAPMIRPRGGPVIPSVRPPRPRMPVATSTINVQNSNNNQRIIKRPSDVQDLQAKKKRMDVLVPDPNDDADCQVIAVQPKNMDGGLPQIQSVQGGTAEPSDNIMHLSDSITLSVRNPPPKPETPKKSDAKVVANILATRGITVTAAPKPKNSPTKEGSQSPSVAINLNSAVSIIPTAKGNSPTPASKQPDSKLPTVDLTDDSIPEPARNTVTRQLVTSPQKTRPGALPFRCDLCPAQYPTAQGLSKHRQSYHKTGSPCEIGIPLIDFKQPGIVQKLTNLGIYNFIPLPNSTPNGNFALPVVSVNAARNSSVCNLAALGASSILTLGPVRSLPKPQVNNSNSNNVPAPKQQ